MTTVPTDAEATAAVRTLEAFTSAQERARAEQIEKMSFSERYAYTKLRSQQTKMPDWRDP
jgi:hypothetical protein